MKVIGAATVGVLAIAVAGAGGYAAGSSTAADIGEAAAVTTRAYSASFSTSRAVAQATGLADGRKRGQKIAATSGRREGRSAGARDGANEARKREPNVAGCPAGLELVQADAQYGVPGGCFAREGPAYEACLAAGGTSGQPPEYSVSGGRPICIP